MRTVRPPALITSLPLPASPFQEAQQMTGIQIKGHTWFSRVNIFTGSSITPAPHAIGASVPRSTPPRCLQGIHTRPWMHSYPCSSASQDWARAVKHQLLGKLDQQSSTELSRVGCPSRMPRTWRGPWAAPLSDTNHMGWEITRSGLLPTVPVLTFFHFISRLCRVSPLKGNFSKENI